MDDPIRRLPRNALYSTAAAFLPVVVAVLSTPFILSRLGNEAFGLYLVALSVAGFAGLMDLGLGTASIKFISEYRARGDSQALSDFVNTVLITRLPQGLMIAYLGYFSAAFVCSKVLMVPSERLSDAIFVVRVSVLTLSVALIGGSLAALPRALHRFDIASRIATLHGLLLTATTVIIVAAGYGLRAIVLGEFALSILSLCASATIARRLLPEWRPQWRYSTQSAASLLHFGGLTMLNALAGFVFLHANRIVIGRSLGLATIPFFAIPWSLTSRVTQLTNALTEAVAPAASALSATAIDARVRTLYERGINLTAVVATAFLVPLGVGAFDLLALWLGPEFGLRGGAVLRTLALSAFVQALSSVPYFILMGLGRPAAANLPALVAALLNTVLAIVLLPHQGLLGVALALLIALTVQTVMLIRSAEIHLALVGTAARSLAGPVTASAIAVVAGILVGSHLGTPLVRLMGACTAAGLVHQGMLVMLGCYRPRELRMIWSALFSRRSSGMHSTSGNA
jgi:O-antigen/teichoic acid export membrane protein